MPLPCLHTATVSTLLHTGPSLQNYSLKEGFFLLIWGTSALTPTKIKVGSSKISTCFFTNKLEHPETVGPATSHVVALGPQAKSHEEVEE